MATDSHDDTVLDAAIRWHIRLLTQPADPHTRQGFETWLSEHPTHAHVWQRLQDMGGRWRPASTTLGPEAIAGVLRRASSVQARRSRRKVLGALGALGLGSALSWRMYDAAGWQRVWADHSTGRGERRRLALPDGSVLHLNTDSAVNIRYDAHARRVVLLAGEIYLESAADPQGRGLWVESAEGRAQALGTRYRVWREAHATGVAVDAGSVALWPALADPTRAAAILGPGQQARLTTHEALDIHPIARDTRDDSAWVNGQLSVRNLPLSAVLDELARHHGPIAYEPDVAPLRVSGDFRLDDTRGILALLGEALPVTITRRRTWWGSTVTQVQRRSGAARDF